jgi:hypothetical protein
MYEPPINWNDYEDIALKLYERFGDEFNEGKYTGFALQICLNGYCKYQVLKAQESKAMKVIWK